MPDPVSDRRLMCVKRDLHDGTQQRPISLGLELRSVEESIPAAMENLRLQVAHFAKSLDEAVVDLQELSRNPHPWAAPTPRAARD
jgi:Histidine kinase